MSIYFIALACTIFCSIYWPLLFLLLIRCYFHFVCYTVLMYFHIFSRICIYYEIYWRSDFLFHSIYLVFIYGKKEGKKGTNKIRHLHKCHREWFSSQLVCLVWLMVFNSQKPNTFSPYPFHKSMHIIVTIFIFPTTITIRIFMWIMRHLNNCFFSYYFLYILPLILQRTLFHSYHKFHWHVLFVTFHLLKYSCQFKQWT